MTSSAALRKEIALIHRARLQRNPQSALISRRTITTDSILRHVAKHAFACLSQASQKSGVLAPTIPAWAR